MSFADFNGIPKNSSDFNKIQKILTRSQKNSMYFKQISAELKKIQQKSTEMSTELKKNSIKFTCQHIKWPKIERTQQIFTESSIIQKSLEIIVSQLAEAE